MLPFARARSPRAMRPEIVLTKGDGQEAPRRRRPGAAATREAILAAAQRVFTRHGYEGAGLRAIAAEAGATAALVIRYFGSKEALFAAALGEKFRLDPIVGLEAEDLPRALAHYVVRKSAAIDGEFDPLIAMLRSAGHPDAAAVMRQGLEDGVVEQLAGVLGGRPGDRHRAAAILAVLSGFAVVGKVLGLSNLDDDAAEDLLAAALQTLVSPPEPA